MNEFGLNVLYEDNHLLVVEKPVNMPVQSDASGDLDLLTLCKRYIKETYNKPGEVYLGLVHRLDRPVGGVMVFARTGKAAARLTAQFKNRQAKKRYVAIVAGQPPYFRALSDWLLKNERTNTTSVVAEGTPEAKLAKLRYCACAYENGTALLDVELFTGRPHQIRVQLSHDGFPIVGDMRYNPEAKVGTQIRLWAYALTISHPTLNEPLTFYSTPNWAEYATQLALLPAAEVCRGVYLDEAMVVVDKHAGVEVEGELEANLSALLGTVYPVHRLDANTEGMVVFARTETMQKSLEQAFYHHAPKKLYRAVLCGVPKEGRLVHYAKKDAQQSMVRLCSASDPSAQRMESELRVLKTNGTLSLCEIELFTGRTHQIRVQTAAIGHPVLGDEKYGDFSMNRRFKKRRQQLLAKTLVLNGKTFESTRELTLEEV